MKIKELIAKLQGFNPEDKICIFDNHAGYYVALSEIQAIRPFEGKDEQGRSEFKGVVMEIDGCFLTTDVNEEPAA